MSQHIDHIFYINLERRQDRRVQIEDELNKMCVSYERFEAIVHKEPFIGCSYSHLYALKLAKKRGYKNILILEDDFTFLVSKEELDRRLEIFFKMVPDYNVLMLSYNLKKSQEIHSLDDFQINRVLFAQTASGILIHGDYYDKLIQLYEWAIPLSEETRMHWVYAIDSAWKTLQEKDAWYCISPRIGKQRDSYSDLAGCVVSYDV